MRIIAGTFRRHILIAPKGRQTRPTSDRLRETLFNVLAPQVPNAVFADLFSGTGAVGMEALSRGARQVYFAENAKEPLLALRQNLEQLKVGSEVQVEPAGTMPLLHRLVQQGLLLDIVFLDPPYSDRRGYETALRFLAEQPILAAGAIVIAEHARRSALPELTPRVQSYRRIEQGEAALTFFRYNT